LRTTNDGLQSLLQSPVATDRRSSLMVIHSIFDHETLRAEFKKSGISDHFIPVIWKYVSLLYLTFSLTKPRVLLIYKCFPGMYSKTLATTLIASLLSPRQHTPFFGPSFAS
jgi:hypothetical protein